MHPTDRVRALVALNEVKSVICRENPGRVLGVSSLLPSSLEHTRWEEQGGLDRLVEVHREEDPLTPRLFSWAEQFTETLDTVLDANAVRMTFANNLREIMRSQEARSPSAPSWLKRHMLNWIDRQLGPPTHLSVQERARMTFERLNQSVNRTETRLQQTNAQIDAMGVRVGRALDNVVARREEGRVNQELEAQVVQEIENTVESIQGLVTQFAQNLMEPIVQQVEEAVQTMQTNVSHQQEEVRALTATLVRYGETIAELSQKAHHQSEALQKCQAHIANMEQKAGAIANAIVELRELNKEKSNTLQSLIAIGVIAITAIVLPELVTVVSNGNGMAAHVTLLAF